MILSGIEDISLFQGVYTFDIYKFEDEITLQKNKICKIDVLIQEKNSNLSSKFQVENQILVLIKELNVEFSNIKNDLENFLIQEIPHEFKKENIKFFNSLN